MWKNTFQVIVHLRIRAKTSCQTNLKNIWTQNSIQVSVTGPSLGHELGVILDIGHAWIGTGDYNWLLHPDKSFAQRTEKLIRINREQMISLLHLVYRQHYPMKSFPSTQKCVKSRFVCVYASNSAEGKMGYSQCERSFTWMEGIRNIGEYLDEAITAWRYN